MHTQLDAHDIAGNRSPSSHVPLRRRNLVLSAVAMLSDQEIELMNREDLLNVLQMARSVSPRSVSPRSEERNIDNMEVPELRSALAIVREYFRKQVNQQSAAKRWSPEFN